MSQAIHASALNGKNEFTKLLAGSPFPYGRAKLQDATGVIRALFNLLWLDDQALL